MSALAAKLRSPWGLRLGAWVARSDEATAALLAALIAEDAPWRLAVTRAPNGSQPPALHISPPGNNPAALALLKNAGVEIVLDDLIMRHDFPDASGAIHPARQRVAWVYGWLAAMVF